MPLNFLAVRLAQPLVHPRTFSSAGGLPDSMLFAFLVCLAGMALLWTTLVWFELDAKAASANLGRIRRRPGGDGVIPLLAIENADRYVGGAYLVFLLLLLIYVAIMAAKLQRIQRELGSLADLAERPGAGPADRDVGHVREREAGDRGRAPGGPRMSGLLALGVSHRTAPLALREQLALTEGRAAGVLNGARLRGADQRGRRALHLQPHRALPGGHRLGRGRGGGARRPRPGGRDPPRPSCSARSTRCAAPRRRGISTG